MVKEPAKFSPEEIRELRKRLGLSRRDLAVKLGLGHRAIELWELGYRTPNPTAKMLLESLANSK